MTIPPATADHLTGAPDRPNAGGARPTSSGPAHPRHRPVDQSESHEDETGGHPDADSRVVLDIGADIGALVLHAPPDLAGAEIEISRAADPAAPRTHAIVRERRTRHSAPAWPTEPAPTEPAATAVTAVFAAVYPGLPAGTYTVWRDASTPAGTVQVNGGEVASWRWDPG